MEICLQPKSHKIRNTLSAIYLGSLHKCEHLFDLTKQYIMSINIKSNCLDINDVYDSGPFI